MSENPLLQLTQPLPFDRVLPAHIEPGILTLLERAERAIDAIAEEENKSYETTFAALERATSELEVGMGIVEHLESVQTSDELRAAYNAILPKVSAFYSGITLNEPLYRALVEAEKQLDRSTLTDIQRRAVDKTLHDFKRHGAELDDEGKQRLRAIDQALSEKTTQFSQNVLDGTNAFSLVVSEERLDGLPASARAMAKESAEAKGLEGYRLTLQAPSVVAVLTHADDASLREEIWRAFNQRGRGKYENLPTVVEILRLRRDKARLLGFDNFADFATHDRMAQSGREAIEFVKSLRERTEAAFLRENDELLAFRRQLEGPEAPALQPWDVAYYAEKQRQALYDFDEEQLRPYFSAPRVLQGAFDLASALYGIRIEDADLPVWDAAVRAHKIVSESGATLGHFYTDLYPRESKRDGAWMHGLVAEAPPTPHVALFCLNAQPPSASAPSLMGFRDVETVFHEFGHLLHHCLSTVPVRSLSCTRVAQDFVELPSQIMENWCIESEALGRFAKHYETGEPLPEALVNKLIAARNFRAANAQMRQLGFAAVDLALHVEFDLDAHSGDEAAGALNDFANAVLQEYSVTRLPEDYSMIAAFGHLFSHPVGYAAGYYSYKWAEVLDADAFGRFKEEGLFSREVGAAFRDSILSRGDSADPLDLFVEFRGRPPSTDAMLERQGLLSQSA